ncbi:recombinase family protein [Nocardioides terrisoli]|uniref:recombinase family protein n=1 Tax=Nocardioides terrisoli TaxID=3388267 RepID=UPI00287B9F6B|nr:recombinase family protein [Nocardioides marmorisolisilvae]
MRAVGYARLSKSKRHKDGSIQQDPCSIEAQRGAIERAAEFNGWDMLGMYVDNGKTGANTKRDGLRGALAVLSGGDADILVIARLDRLTRDTADFLDLVKLSTKEGWALAVLDQKVDTSTAVGRLMARTLASHAEFERDLISERTRDALAVLKAQGKQLGKPSQISPELERRIIRLHKQGKSASAIARRLSADGIETPTGKDTWHHSVIVDLIKRNAA